MERKLLVKKSRGRRDLTVTVLATAFTTHKKDSISCPTTMVADSVFFRGIENAELYWVVPS